jgi:hypothetical protein
MRTISVHLRKAYIFALLGLAAVSAAALASDEPAAARSAISVDQIALELSNPVTALRSLAIDIEYREYQGDLPRSDDLSAWRYVFTPSWPFRLSNGNNILLSATIPVNGDQPIWNRRRLDTPYGRDFSEWKIRQAPAELLERDNFISGHAHLDDVGVNIGYGGVSENGYIGMIGLASVFQTSTDAESSRRQYLLGPEFAFGKVMGRGLIGARAKHVTDVFSDRPWNTNETTVKMFFAYGLGNGWQIESNPIIRYDWEAVSGNEWLVPIGVGVSKTTRLGGIPLKMAVEIQKFAVSADRFGPEWLLGFNFTPVISTKLLR